MTEAQIIALEQQGHEIGGHTLTHANLPTLTDADARDADLQRPRALLANGFRVTSFAYPFGADNASVQQIVDGLRLQLGARRRRAQVRRRVPRLPVDQPGPADESVRDPDERLDPLRHHAGGARGVRDRRRAERRRLRADRVPPRVRRLRSRFDQPRRTLAAFLDWLAQRAPATTVGDRRPGDRRRRAAARSTHPRRRTSRRTRRSRPTPTATRSPTAGSAAATARTRRRTRSSATRSTAVAQRIDVTSFTSGARRLVTAQDTGACAPRDHRRATATR